MGDLVIMGLPTSGLAKLTGNLDCRHVEDADIRRIYDHPRDTRDLTAEAIVSRWAKYLEENGTLSQGILVYQTPWGALKHQFRTSSTIPRALPELESYASNLLRFWHSYHLALFGLRRHHNGQFVLINGERPVDIGTVVALLERRFGLKLDAKERPYSSDADQATQNSAEVFCQIVDVLAPECLELYAELESCAELMGRQPEFEFTSLGRSRAFVLNSLECSVRQLRIEHLLDQHDRGMGDAELRLEDALKTLEASRAGEPEKKRHLSALEDRIAVLQKEVDRRSLQIRELEEKLSFGHAQIDTHLSRIQQLEEVLRSRHAEAESHSARVRQVEERLANETSRRESLEKENELCLLQLHQMQEELEHYFELSQQSERQIADLHKDLESQSSPFSHKMRRNVLGLKKSAASAIVSSVRANGGWFWWMRKDERIRRQQMQTIRSSGLFDENWYLQRYPDVAQAGFDPIDHYLKYGAFEARNPSVQFDSQWYLETYADVADAKMNPLLHYIEYGKSEGRQPRRFVA